MKERIPSCFVARIDLALKEKLREDLLSQGFLLEEAPFAFFLAKKQGLSCTLYHSGKLTIQGKNKEDFISFYLEPEILHNLSYTHPEVNFDTRSRIGLDEAGKGDFFGPLCVAGLFVPEEKFSTLLKIGVKDSKQLSDPTILTMSRKIKEHFPHEVLFLFPKTYNHLYAKFANLNYLLGWSHLTVLEKLVKTTGCTLAFLDQFASPGLMESFLKRKQLQVDLKQRVRGEEDPVVAGASILARAAFLEGMEKLEKEHGLSLPKGASSSVIQAAKKAVENKGFPILEQIAKTHFKTMEKLTDAS